MFFSKHKNTALLKSSIIIFITSMVGNFSNYLFQFFMGRHLTPEEFGLLNSLLSLTVIAGVPSKTIMMAVAKYTVEYEALGEMGKVRQLLIGSHKKVFLFCCLGFTFLAFTSSYIRSFLLCPSTWSIMIVGTILSTSFIMPINLGVIQGLQNAKLLGSSLGMAGLFRLFFGILLIYLGLKVNGALFASVLSSLAVIVITLIQLKKVFHHQEKADMSKQTKEIIGYSIPVLVASFFLVGIVNVDLVLVKHYFPAQEVGYYSAAAILGRAIFYFPAAITLATFPAAAKLHAKGQNPLLLLKEGLLLTFGSTIIGAGIFWFLPKLTLSMLFGQQYLPSVSLLKVFGFAMVPYAMVSLITDFNLARHRTRFIATLAFAFLAQIALISIYHTNLLQVIYILFSIGIALFLVNIGTLLLEGKFS